LACAVEEIHAGRKSSLKNDLPQHRILWQAEETFSLQERTAVRVKVVCISQQFFPWRKEQK
jgi:hypothetical protein